MGPNFYGIYQISINSSGQFNVPTEQLDVLRVLTEESGGRLWVTRDVDDECLTIYRHDEWSVIRKKIQQLQNFTKEFRRISRRIDWKFQASIHRCCWSDTDPERASK